MIINGNINELSKHNKYNELKRLRLKPLFIIMELKMKEKQFQLGKETTYALTYLVKSIGLKVASPRTGVR